MSCVAGTDRMVNGRPLACWSSSRAAVAHRAGVVSRAGAVRLGRKSLGARGWRGSCMIRRGERKSARRSGRPDWHPGGVFSTAGRKIFSGEGQSSSLVADTIERVSARTSLLDVGSSSIMLDLQPLIMIPASEIGYAMRRRSAEPATCWGRSLKLGGESWSGAAGSSPQTLEWSQWQDGGGHAAGPGTGRCSVLMGRNRGRGSGSRSRAGLVDHFLKWRLDRMT